MLGNVLVPTTLPTRRDLKKADSRNEESGNIYRQTPRKSPHEVSRIGIAAHVCGNSMLIKEIAKTKVRVDEIWSGCVRRALKSLVQRYT